MSNPVSVVPVKEWSPAFVQSSARVGSSSGRDIDQTLAIVTTGNGRPSEVRYVHQVDGEDTRQELRASHNPRGWVRVDLLGQADFDASGKYIHLDAGYGDLFANSRQSRKDMPGQSRRGVGGVPAWWWQIGARRSCGTGARIPGMRGRLFWV